MTDMKDQGDNSRSRSRSASPSRKRSSKNGMFSSIRRSTSVPSLSRYKGHKSKGVHMQQSLPTYSLKSSMRVRTLDESLHSKYGESIISQSSDISDRSVSFHEVQFREYERSLGDNPSCSGGAPISIGWSYNEGDRMGVEDYEGNRPPRRSTNEMAIPRSIRANMLLDEWEYSRKDIAKAVRDSVKVKNQRRRTVVNLDKMKVEAAVESASRKLKRTVLRKKKDTHYYDMWRLEAERANKYIAEENAAAAADIDTKASASDDENTNGLENGTPPMTISVHSKDNEEGTCESDDGNNPVETEATEKTKIHPKRETENTIVEVEVDKSSTVGLHQVPLKKVTPVIICEEPTDSIIDDIVPETD